jgi:hypothetical protein
MQGPHSNLPGRGKLTCGRGCRRQNRAEAFTTRVLSDDPHGTLPLSRSVVFGLSQTIASLSSVADRGIDRVRFDMSSVGIWLVCFCGPPATRLWLILTFTARGMGLETAKSRERARFDGRRVQRKTRPLWGENRIELCNFSYDRS